LLIGVLIGSVLSWALGTSSDTNESIVETNEPIVNTIVEANDFTPTEIMEEKIISLGEYKLTAYCSCEKCCGYWATIRPLDEDGNPIVYTADGSVAKQGVTIAADTSVLPFDSKILIDGHEYIVQDRGGAIKGNRIDVYFESHEEALQFGVQYKEIFLKEGKQ
jgi:3D (Asp-Asp-Asp) domain-containing protein